MIFETVKTDGLAQLGYVVGDSAAGVCAVIDPRRDVDVYLDIARAHGVPVTHVLETHIHADFVSGGRELAARTGAALHGGRSDDYGFELEQLGPGDEVRLGRFRLRVLHTPGHSPEHVCYVLSRKGEEPWAVFTGDTLFSGSVGRPDLATGASEEELARRLYRSLREELLPLGDHMLAYPGHGAGSPCGADIGERDVTTLGYERRTNPKLRAESEDAFVEAVLGDLPDVPDYYPRMKEVNAAGPEPTGGLPYVPPLPVDAFARILDGEDALVVDGREIEAFGGAHIEGSLSIALRSSFPVWAGRILPPDRPLLLVLPDDGDLDEVQRHLFRIGLDRIVGYLAGGMREWTEAGRPFRRWKNLSVQELRERTREGRSDGLQILDVRSDEEWRSGHVPGATHVFVPELRHGTGGLDPERPVAVYCGSGYRSSLAASLLERGGFREVHNVPGSISAWTAADYPLSREEDGGD